MKKISATPIRGFKTSTGGAIATGAVPGLAEFFLELGDFVALAKSWGLKPATLAIAWTLAKAPHVVPIPGTRAAAHLGECAAAAEIDLTDAQLAEIERALPVGFAAGERYSEQQWVGIQKY